MALAPTSAPVGVIRRIFMRLFTPLLIAALLWEAVLIVLWLLDSGFQTDEFKANLRSIAWLFAALMVTEALFVAGAILALASVGAAVIRKVFQLKWRVHKIWWLLKDEFQHAIGSGIRSPVFFTGLILNWVGAVGTGVVWAAAILVLVPPLGWWQLILPAYDIFASMMWRGALLRRLRFAGPTVTPATLDDVPDLVRIDAEAYGELTAEQTASPEAMWAARLHEAPGWLLLSRSHGVPNVLLAMFPTTINPDAFVSWDDTTANGTYRGKVVRGSRTAYGTALTAAKSHGFTDVIATMAAGVSLLIRQDVHEIYFLARLSGYHKLGRARGMSIEDYATTMRGKYPLDPLMREFEMLGMQRMRLIPQGWPLDSDSGGAGMLYRVRIPFSGWPGKRLWATLVASWGRSALVLALLIRAFAGR